MSLRDILRRRKSEFGRLLAGFLCGALSGVAAHANPTGPTVVQGSAQFLRPDAHTLNVTTAAGTVVNWQGFSIGRGELTRFIQPSATDAVLNRVTGPDPSAILGRLQSNGRVFLINPHGIVFGRDTVVDTAGLVASTLGITDADFLAGRYRFEGGPDAGRVVNRGRIEAGAEGVFLLAPSIENSGVVRTDGGDLVLAAGRRATLTSLDLDGVRVEVQAPEDEVLNLGDLIAERGAAGVLAGTIRSSGTVEANAVTVDDDGIVRLVARSDITLETGGRVAAEGSSSGKVHIESETGTTSVSGEVSARASEGRGGTVRLLGHRVGLAGARVDASGPGGGGRVLVGGDVRGKGSVLTAESTWVSADSTVAADALDDGDGGTVVVFAEDFANVQGRLSARGGPYGGDGGFVETSGLDTFVIVQVPDISAPNGGGGEWLIDPNDIEIVPGGGALNVDDADPFTSTDDGAQLGIDLIIAALSGGQRVTVQTTESGESSQGGYITLNAPFDIERTAGTNTLILDAHGGINVNRPITDAGGGAELHLVLDAGDIDVHGIEFNADVILHGGSLTTDADYLHVQNGATMTLDGVRWQENSRHVAISSGVGDSGALTVRDGASIDATSWFNVAQNGGTGILTIADGGVMTTARGVGIGDGLGSAGTVTVTDSSSTLTVDGTDGGAIVLGFDGGSGTLTIEAGAEVIGSSVKAGFGAGGSGVVTVTGSGSLLTALGSNPHFFVGEQGMGTLSILGGAKVSTGLMLIGVHPDSRGTVTVTGSGSALATEGPESAITVGDDGVGELTTASDADVSTERVIVGHGASGHGTVTVTGSGSSLTTVGDNNEVFVGNYGTGTIQVLDGGLVDTRKFHLAWWGVGRAVIRGVAADGTRSRVIVWPANGRDPDFPSEGGFARVARNDGSNGRLEILEGGLLRVLDTDDTSGPFFHLARNKGSVGTLLIDGEGSSLEVIENSPGGENGPSVALGRRGRGITTIRNGGRLLLQGERALADISRDTFNPEFPDSDIDSINQSSTVNIHSGGRIEVSGERARLIVGNAGPAANGEIIATGRGSMIIVSGDGNRLVVGDDEARGVVEVHNGASAQFGELVVGPNGFTNLSVSELAQQEINEIVGEILPYEDDDDGESSTESDSAEADEGEEEQEELQMCPS